MLQWIQQSFRNTSEDNVNSRLAYITHDDLCSSFEGDTLLAIRAPPHTHLEVPIPEDDQVRLCTKGLRMLVSNN
jgi:transcription factor E2F4/5